MTVGFRFSSRTDEIDRDRVHRWLSEESYWALGRPRAVLDAAIDNSRNYGIFDEATGEQVAYARVITDAATFAWLADVFVAADARGVGLGTRLMDGIFAELDALNLRRVALVTSDAHSLYAKYGLQSLPDPERWMARVAP